MRWIIFTFASSVLLLCGAGIVALWAVSGYHGYMVWIGPHGSIRGGTNIGVESVFGRIYLDMYIYDADPQLQWAMNFHSWSVTPDGDSPEWRKKYLRFGFGKMSYSQRGVRYHALLLPHWFVAILCFLPSLIWWRYLRYSARRGGHFCTVCSYNLTGNASGVCPECGTAIKIRS